MGKKTADNKCPAQAKGSLTSLKEGQVQILDAQGRHVLESTQRCGSQLCSCPLCCRYPLHGEGLFPPPPDLLTDSWVLGS